MAPGDIAVAGFQRPLTEPGVHLSLCTRLSRNHGESRLPVCSTDRACVECRVARRHPPDHSSPRMFPPSSQLYRFPACLRHVHGFPMLRLLRRLRPSMKPSLVYAASSTCQPSSSLRFPCSGVQPLLIRWRALPLATRDGSERSTLTVAPITGRTSREPIARPVLFAVILDPIRSSRGQ